MGDHTTFQYNVVKNCYAVDDHHDDGFQSWSVGEGGVGTGEVVGIVLRGNTIIGYEDPDQPHRGTLQGIGCFDGTFVDWVIENNVVITDHWHGITLLGARDSTIAHNTVIDLNADSPGPPWISIDDHKDGTPPSGCSVRNNLTTDLANAGSVIEEGNIQIGMDELDQYFAGATIHDLHLRDDAPAIDAAQGEAPALDRDGIRRPQGAAPDVGAYEWHDGSAVPQNDTGGDDADTGGDGTAGGTGAADGADTDSAGGGGSEGGTAVGSSDPGDPPGGDGSGGGTDADDDTESADAQTGDPEPGDGGCSALPGRAPAGRHGAWLGMLLAYALVRRRMRMYIERRTARG